MNLSTRLRRALPLLCALLAAQIHASWQQPQLTTTSVYPFAPFFVTQPSSISSTVVQATPYGAYAFAYLQISQSQVNTVTLPCLAQANPSPTYKWRINGTLIQPNMQYSYNQNGPGDLTITPLSPGTYQCVVTSGSLVAYSDIVNLTAAGMTITTAAVTNSVSLQQGSYYRMPSSPIVYSSFPPPIITWQRDNNQLNTNSYQFQSVSFDGRVILDELGRIHITFVQQSDCCTGSWTPYLNYYRLRYQLSQTTLQQTPVLTLFNVSSWPTSPTFSAIQQQYITPSPLTALVGTSARIVCIYSGSPPIVVSYSKLVNGTSISIDTSTAPNVLIIQNVQLSDSGTYQCQARQTSNSGSGSNPAPQTITLNVLSPPIWTSKPNDVFVPVGGELTLPCAATGNPAVTTQWLVNGNAVAANDPAISSAGYTVMNVQKPSSNAAIQCVVQNSYATYVASVAVTAITPTQIVSAPSNRLQIQPNSVVSFSCEATGDPLLDVYITWQWTDINGNVHPVVNYPPGFVISMNKNGSDCQETLTIDTSQFNDKNLFRGSYTCLASNGWSYANSTGRLSFYGDADGLVTASFDLWIIGVIVGVLVLIAIIVLIVVCCLRNRGGTYGVDEKERAQGNNPTEDLRRMHGFTEYMRPDSEPPSDARAPPRYMHLPTPHRPTYPPAQPEADYGEDGSFRGAYAPSPPPGASSPRQASLQHAPPSPYAATNPGFQPAYDMAAQPSVPPRSKAPAPPSHYAASVARPSNYGASVGAHISYDNPGVNDSAV